MTMIAHNGEHGSQTNSLSLTRGRPTYNRFGEQLAQSVLIGLEFPRGRRHLPNSGGHADSGERRHTEAEISGRWPWQCASPTISALCEPRALR